MTRAGPTLAELREYLRSKLNGYKMPTISRVVKGELPKPGAGKVQKKILGPQFFPPNYREIPDVQVCKSGARIRRRRFRCNIPSVSAHDTYVMKYQCLGPLGLGLARYSDNKIV